MSLERIGIQYAKILVTQGSARYYDRICQTKRTPLTGYIGVIVYEGGFDSSEG